MKIVINQMRIEEDDTIVLRMFAEYKNGKVPINDKADANIYLRKDESVVLDLGDIDTKVELENN